MAKTAIAIIGATGNMGSAIAKSLAKGPYRLLLFAHDKAKLESVKQDITKATPSADIDCVGCPMDASWEADVIISAVPYAAEKDVVEKIRNVATQKVVVSIANPLNETYDGLVTEPGTSAAEELQKLLPSSKVVKAFNTTYAADFAQPVINGQQVDAFIAGNDEDAVDVVKGLVTTAGFNAIVAGDLSKSRTLEAMQALLIQLTIKNNYNWLAGFKILHN
ncbi:NADPH-dependent F420 reductase [Flavisolibacter nicotianae]|uniref:NADPH-dependent F420 reductase n=1 Tax=Flavisolibacter nicotianae TaxID=2364882 RepID=UPI000EAE77C1|nr:NAD(P)-binding domain-containing protein [Flavisolibacter nicotianae]